ncbi:unnamed protein product, partial [Prorocentrum cordatum]
GGSRRTAMAVVIFPSRASPDGASPHGGRALRAEGGGGRRREEEEEEEEEEEGPALASPESRRVGQGARCPPTPPRPLPWDAGTLTPHTPTSYETARRHPLAVSSASRGGPRHLPAISPASGGGPRHLLALSSASGGGPFA